MAFYYNIIGTLIHDKLYVTALTPSLENRYMFREIPIMGVVIAPVTGTGAPGLRSGPYKTSQVGPFCLAASFLFIQQECGLRNLAPVAWHLVKLIHRQETNCQIKWVSGSLPLPSRLACGWDGTAFLPLFFPLLFSRHVTVECSALSCNRTREVRFPVEGGIAAYYL